MQTLQQALEHLYGLERRRDKLGLDGTRALLAALGHPESRFRAVHVAGTNGKGSVCALVERVLRECGVRTGLFTSPHLVDFRERIRVNGRWADEARLFEDLSRIEALPEGRDRTFFEIATALGFEAFAAAGVEWGVIEVGLGGRLDTTNVVEPAVCAITGIALDHTEVLGDTLEAIAAEKAGIVKPGVPVVLAPDLDPRARGVIHEVAGERGAPVLELPAWPASGGIESWGAAADLPWRDLAPNPPAGIEPRNAATALGVLAALHRAGLAIPARAVAAGFASTRWPGRFERCPDEPRLWWDGAHNPDGVAALTRAWSRAGLAAPGAIVLALSRDKDAGGMLAPLAAIAPGAVLVVTRTRNERAMAPAEIAVAARRLGFDARLAASVASACTEALSATTAPVLLTGSLFAVGEAMEARGGAPGEQQ